MKKLFLVCAVLMLSGCSVLDAYLMTHYDSNEYKIITDIRTDSQIFKTQCDDAVASKTNAVKIANETKLFALYSEHIPRNDLLISSSKDLNTIAQGLADQYIKSDKVSVGFCKIKFSSIETNAEKMQQVIGKRPR